LNTAPLSARTVGPAAQTPVSDYPPALSVNSVSTVQENVDRPGLDGAEAG